MPEVWLVFVVWGLVALVLALAVAFIIHCWNDHQARKSERRPGYVEINQHFDPGPSAAENMRKVVDAFSKMSWGTPSTRSWEQACQESLERSRARRARSRKEGK